MLVNYFKIAIAVLRRQKFFTFISLFGISFTLTIVIVVAAFVDETFSPGYPDVNRDRELYVDRMQLRNTKNESSINAGPSYYFIDHYVSRLRTPVKIAILSGSSPVTTYINSKKYVNSVRSTNDQFWEVLQYDFIEGKPYTKQQVDNGERVAVITERTRKSYFGEGVPTVGKYIETLNRQYRVIGVVRSLAYTSNVFADIYIPLLLTQADIHDFSLIGGHTCILLLDSKADISRMKDEFNRMAAKVPIDDKRFDRKLVFADTYLESFFREIHMGFTEGADGGVGISLLIVSIFFLLFLLMPTLNLVNINISRIMDRYSEIGVRKAFGASSRTLVYQFIVENLILTFIGGAVGVGLSFITIQIINSRDFMDTVHLVVNFHVLFFAVFASLVFGLLSGVYPAWRMSRMNVVTALKTQ
jgi:putative ABC transport system permease protein